VLKVIEVMELKIQPLFLIKPLQVQPTPCFIIQTETSLLLLKWFKTLQIALTGSIQKRT